MRRLVADGVPQRQVARDLGINDTTLGNWVEAERAEVDDITNARYTQSQRNQRKDRH